MSILFQESILECIFAPVMIFELTEEQLAVQQAARDFAQTELLPGVIERDNNQEFPYEQIKKLGELGFLGMMVDPKYGGSGMVQSVMYWLWKN